MINVLIVDPTWGSRVVSRHRSEAQAIKSVNGWAKITPAGDGRWVRAETESGSPLHEVTATGPKTTPPNH